MFVAEGENFSSSQNTHSRRFQRWNGMKDCFSRAGPSALFPAMQRALQRLSHRNLYAALRFSRPREAALHIAIAALPRLPMRRMVMSLWQQVFGGAWTCPNDASRCAEGRAVHRGAPIDGSPRAPNVDYVCVGVADTPDQPRDSCHSSLTRTTHCPSH